MYRDEQRKYDDAVKFEILVKWLLESIKNNCVNISNLKQLLIALGTEIREENNNE